MAEDVKKVKIDIRAETTKATNEIKRLNKQIDTLDRQQKKSNASMKRSNATITKMGASFKTLGQHLSRLVVIYGSFQAVTSTVKVMADFEQSIVTLGAISGATGEELSKLEEKAMQLGESTIFSASQVADGMTEMARAGLSAQEQLDGISSVLNLSIIGLVDTAEATRIATTAMNGFGLEAKDLPRIVDVLAQSANNSAQTLEQLSLGLNKVGTVAHQQNVSLEETTAILGVLADAGRRGAEGGTQFKIAMLRMGSNPESTKYLAELDTMFKDLDVSMYNSRGQIKPFTERLKVLSLAFKGLSEEQANQFKTRIFGTEAIASGNIMLANIDKIILKTKLMKSSFGVADTQAIAMMDTLKGSYLELLSALEGLQIKIGKNLSPALRAIIDDTTEFIRTMDAKDIDKFSKSIANLLGFLKDVSGILIELVDASLTFGNELSKAIGGVSNEFLVFIAIIYKLRTALIALGKSNPALLVLAVSVGLVLEKLVEVERQVSKFKDTTNSFISINEDFNATMEGSVKAIQDLNEADLRKFNKQLLTDIKRMDNAILNLTNRIKVLKEKSNTWSGLTATEKIELSTLEGQLSSLNRSMSFAIDLRQKTVDAGKEAVAQANKERDANNQLTVSAKRLTETELKSLNVKIGAMEARKTKLETTLTSMLKTENGYYDQLHKLEQDIFTTRQNFANKRASLNADFENDIATIRASSLNDLQIYNDAQKRADEYLAKSKQALLDGNLVMAKKYMSIYNSLITKNAQSEIKINDKVVKTKQQLNAELIRDKQASHAVELQILAEEENRAIAGINAKIELKKTEIKMNRLQIELQIKAIELQAKMITALTGARNNGFDEDVKKARKELAKFDKEINKVVEQQRTLEIDAVLNKNKFERDTKNVTLKPKVKVEQKEIKDVTKDVEKARIVMTITDIQTGEVETKIDGVRVKAEKPTKFNMAVETVQATTEITKVKEEASADVESVMTVNTDQALAEITKVQEEANKDIKSTMIMSTDKAIASINKVQEEAHKDIKSTMIMSTDKAISSIQMVQHKAKTPTKSIHTVKINATQALQVLARLKRNTSSTHTIYVKTVQKRAMGGFIQREGALSGYGGGDKVKALLEAGEFIVRKEAVRALGIDKLQQINQGTIPKYQTGGLVGSTPSDNTSNRVVDLNLNIGGNTFTTSTDEQTADALASYLQSREF